MFDLETKILEWRKQMLAAGLKAPVPLDELEGHLRERIDLLKAGLSEEEAFRSAADQLGNREVLKQEFSKLEFHRRLLWRNHSWAINILAGLIILFGLLPISGPLRVIYHSMEFGPIFHFYGARFLLNVNFWFLFLFGCLHILVGIGLLRRQNGWRMTAVALSFYTAITFSFYLCQLFAEDFYHVWIKKGPYPYVAYDFLGIRLPIVFAYIVPSVKVAVSIWAIYYLTKAKTRNQFRRAATT